MKFCLPHWDKLRKAISDRGLDSLNSKGGQEAAERMQKGAFDPLMNAHNAIVGNALDHQGGGFALMTANEDGSDRCPLCYLASMCPECQPCEHFEKWIEFAADEQKKAALSLGLLVSA